MDGNSPSRPEFEPPLGARPYIQRLRERAPTLLDEALALARAYPDELGEDPSLFALLDLITKVLPAGRSDLVLEPFSHEIGKIASSIRLVSYTGFLRTKRGAKAACWWPGERVLELAEGLDRRARRSPLPQWRVAGEAAYELFLRICEAIAHEFEIAPTDTE